MALARVSLCLSFLVLIAAACGESSSDGDDAGSGGGMNAGGSGGKGGTGAGGKGAGGATTGGAGSGGANASGATGGGSGSGGELSAGGTSAGDSGSGGSNAGGASAGGSGEAGTSTGGTAAGEAGSGAESGGGNGGNGGSGGSGGANGGASGEGGGVGTYAYPFCDQDLGQENNPGCEPGTICRSGYCTGPCENNITEGIQGTGEDCPQPETGDAFTFCGLGYCWLRCFNGETCPDGMVCNGVPDAENCWNPDALEE